MSHSEGTQSPFATGGLVLLHEDATVRSPVRTPRRHASCHSAQNHLDQPVLQSVLGCSSEEWMANLNQQTPLKGFWCAYGLGQWAVLNVRTALPTSWIIWVSD